MHTGNGHHRYRIDGNGKEKISSTRGEKSSTNQYNKKTKLYTILNGLPLKRTYMVMGVGVSMAERIKGTLSCLKNF